MSSTEIPHPLESWQVIAKRAQEHRDATLALVQPPIPDIQDLPLDSTPIPKTVLTQEELAITESDPVDLVAKLASGSLSSVTVANAFLRRAALAQKLVNCITELMPTAALERAAYLDAYLKEHGKPIGPLHGLPVSTKEMINIKDHTCTAAFIAWHANVPTSNAHILEILLNAGAVLYARTTSPQSHMHLETASNYFGTTVNPFNRTLTAGGSTGGEGALLGLRGSCLGIGTDIGGSIRSPAANCGVYGLRPTSCRLPIQGVSAAMPGAEHILPVIGPLSTSLGGIQLFMQTLIAARPWLRAPSLVPLPWRPGPHFPLTPSGAQKAIRVGLLLDDGVVKPHPPVLRTLTQLAARLADIPGIEVVPFSGHAHDAAWTIISSLYFADDGAEMRTALADEPLLPLTRHILEGANVRALSVAQVWAWTLEREKYRARYAECWAESGVDVVLCPAGPGVAPRLETARWWGYTSLWNLLDYPAVVAPVSRVLPTDAAETGYVPRNGDDGYNYGLYEGPETYENAPVAVQLVGRRYEDEKVVEAMQYFVEKLGLPWAENV